MSEGVRPALGCLSELRIQHHCTLEMSVCVPQSLVGFTGMNQIVDSPTPLILPQRFDVARATGKHARALLLVENDIKCSGDTFGDVALEREQIARCPVVRARPELKAIRRTDPPSRNPPILAHH